jgi:hypothetical protein
MIARKLPYLVAAAALALGGCYSYNIVTGSGVSAARTLDYTGFTEVVVDAAAALTVRHAPAYRVTVAVDDNLIDLVTVYPSAGGEALTIGMDRSFRYEQYSLAVVVEMPTLAAIRQSTYTPWGEGGRPSLVLEDGFVQTGPVELILPPGSVTIENLVAGDVTIRAASGSTVLGSITCDALDLSVHSQANVTLTGGAVELDLSSYYDTALVDLSAFAANNAHVTLEGGEARVNATGLLDGALRWDAVLKYKNNPGLVLDIEGATEENLITFD